MEAWRRSWACGICGRGGWGKWELGNIGSELAGRASEVWRAWKTVIWGYHISLVYVWGYRRFGEEGFDLLGAVLVS